MKLSYLKYFLELNHQFTISHSSRRTTPVVLVKIEQDGYCGYGEASLPPYLKETQDSVISFIEKIILKNVYGVNDVKIFCEEIENNYNGNYAAKAALNIALNDLVGKILGNPCYQLYDIPWQENGFYTSYTIGIDTDETTRSKILNADEFKILKIKLGTDRDKEIINTVRDVTDKPLFVDANQGWKDEYFALEMINWLETKNVLLIEQPMPVNLIEESCRLKEKSPLPIIADEALQTFSDIDRIKNLYHGLNIKLMKCGGINEGLKIIKYAKEIGLKTMLGCMTETSCGISAAIQLAPFADYIDLDGNLLIKNDPFEINNFENGLIFMNKLPGLGIKEKQKLFL